MENSKASCSKDGLFESGAHSNLVLPRKTLKKILKYLNNVQDLAQVRRVCRFWCIVATPLYLRKIDAIEINFGATDRKEAIYRRALSDKYREKQRQIPNRKLSQKEIDEIDHEISMKNSAGEDSHDDNCLITKYCDYIESGGRVQYTNFNFEGIKLIHNEAVLRFFTLCGEHVNILTVYCSDDYWFCDHPDGLCKLCLDQQKTKCVLNMARIKTLVETYSPNVTVLTLDVPKGKEKQSNSNESKDDLDGSDESDDSYESYDSDTDDSESLVYLLTFGDVWKSDEKYNVKNMIPPFPPFNNIQTIRVVDELVASLYPNMFVCELFMLCPNVTSASNFGKKKKAFESFTIDFVRALVNNANTDILTEFLIRNLDSTIINSILYRHKDKLKLKFLKVNHLVTHLAESSFLEFLKSQSATLETIMCGLTQKKNPQWSDDLIRFPKEMPKLTHLRIGLGKQEQERPPKEVAPIDWAKQFPSLKTLMLPEFSTNVTVDAFFEHPDIVEPLTTVTGLELPAKLSINLMAKAGFLFPNVTELAVGYQTIDSLRQIWTMWPKLKSLHLSVIYNDGRSPMKPKIQFLNLNELITGFDKSQMEMVKAGNGHLIGQPNFPSITKLRDLRELTIFGASYRTQSKRSVLEEAHWKKAKKNAVSDISVHHALMKLPSLKYLDISEHFYDITPSADMELCNYMNLFHEDNSTTRNNFTIMCNYRGREEAHKMCRLDAMYKDK